MKKIIKISSAVVIISLAISLAIPSNHYIVRALIYQLPNIDDYKIFDNRGIIKGKAQPWHVSKNYNKYSFSPEQLLYFSEYKTVAYLVIKDTSILSETYWGGYNKDSYSNSFSMSKSIVSLLIGCAIQDGLIMDINQPVSNFIEAYKEGERAKITLRDLLSMSSNLSWDESYSSLFSITTQAYYGNDVKRIVLNLHSLGESGKYFDYRGSDPQLLALVIEKVTGKTLSEYASEKLWKPLGAEQDALWNLDHNGGTEKASCCFNSNARDFARFGQLVLNNGIWKGAQLIPKWYLDEATSPVTELIDKELSKPNERYGYQWWCLKYKNYTIKYARGILGQYIFVIPELNAVIVRLGHKRNDIKIDGHPEDVYRYLDFGFDIIEKTK
ncbi:MAG TPA: serine hydrolase [Bacteroidales bacterium]|nr:serine hydrolase [Bacteroidales bacterium]